MKVDLKQKHHFSSDHKVFEPGPSVTPLSSVRGLSQTWPMFQQVIPFHPGKRARFSPHDACLDAEWVGF